MFLCRLWYILGLMTKRGTPTKKRWQKRGHCFSMTARFSMYMWSLASTQQSSRMYILLPQYTIILHIFTICYLQKAKRTYGQHIWSALCERVFHPRENLIIFRAYWTKSTRWWSLSCDHGLHCSNELMWEQQQQQQQQLLQQKWIVPKMQQVKRSVHKVMYILLYTRTAVALLVYAHNELPGISILLYVRTVIYEYTYKRNIFCHSCFASHKTWLTGPAVSLARTAR